MLLYLYLLQIFTQFPEVWPIAPVSICALRPAPPHEDVALAGEEQCLVAEHVL